MVGVLILTHGPLAEELLEAATTISGAAASGVAALCLDWDVEPEQALEQVRRAGEKIAGDDGLLILTDMFGGTPHNVARQLVAPGSVELLSGVNLPMVVRLCCASREELSLTELSDWIIDKGRNSICRSPGGDCE